MAIDSRIRETETAPPQTQKFGHALAIAALALSISAFNFANCLLVVGKFIVEDERAAFDPRLHILEPLVSTPKIGFVRNVFQRRTVSNALEPEVELDPVGSFCLDATQFAFLAIDVVSVSQGTIRRSSRRDTAG